MATQVLVDVTSVDNEIEKLILKRIKNVLQSDEYIGEIIQSVLAKEIGRRVDAYFHKYTVADKVKLADDIVESLKKKAGITNEYIGRIAYREIQQQVTVMVSNNEKAIQDLFKDDIKQKP